MYPKYLDTLTSYHTFPKFRQVPFTVRWSVKIRTDITKTRLFKYIENFTSKN